MNSSLKKEYVRTWESLRKLTYRIRKGLEAQYIPAGINVVEFRILDFLKSDDKSTLARLSRELTVTREGVALIVEGLESRGLVKRTVVQEEPKLIFISLTASGKRVLAKATRLQEKMIMSSIGQLSESDLKTLQLLIDRLYDKV